MTVEGGLAKIVIKCSDCSRRFTDEGGYVLLANSVNQHGIYCSRHVNSDDMLTFRAGQVNIQTGNIIFVDSGKMQDLVRKNEYLSMVVTSR